MGELGVKKDGAAVMALEVTEFVTLTIERTARFSYACLFVYDPAGPYYITGRLGLEDRELIRKGVVIALDSFTGHWLKGKETRVEQPRMIEGNWWLEECDE